MKITDKSDEASSWFVLINGTHLVQSRVHGDEAHEQRDEATSWLNVNSNLSHLVPSHVHANLSHENDEAHELQQSKLMFYDWLWTQCIRIICTATENDWTPCARRSSSWTTMKKAHQWLWTHFIRAMCTQSSWNTMKVMNNDEASVWIMIDCEFILLHGDRALVRQNWSTVMTFQLKSSGDNGEASSWLIELISYRASVRRRSSWTTTKQAHHSELMLLEPFTRKAHETRWFSWIWSKRMN